MRGFVTIWLLLAGPALAQSPAAPPVAHRFPQTTTLHGETRRDDYAWAKRVQERVIDELRADPHGPEVVVVRPGAIYGPGRQFQYRLGRRVGSVVLLLGGRVPMPLNYYLEPENAAHLLIWLTSEENTHVTGQTIYIDGGSDAALRGDNVWDLAAC